MLQNIETTPMTAELRNLIKDIEGMVQYANIKKRLAEESKKSAGKASEFAKEMSI
jgi:hypothetical protein